MRARLLQFWIVAALIPFCAPSLLAQDPPDIASRISALEKEVEELRKAQAAAPASQPSEKKEDKKEEKKEEKPVHWIVGENLGMTARWNNGLWLESADKAFRFHPMGRLHVDLALMKAGDRVQFAPGGIGRVDDAVAFRRLRLGFEGTIWEVFDFHVEPDYGNTFNAEGPGQPPIIANTFATTDAWGQVSHLPWIGNIRAGSVKPALSLEHLTSSRFLDFMERSLMFDAFVGGLDNGFQPGFVVHNTAFDQRATWQLSATHNQANIFGFNVGDGEYNYCARGTCLPVYEDGGRELLHVGVGVSHRTLDDRQARFRARTLVRNGPAALGTALADLRLAGEGQELIVPELAMVIGPFYMAAEYLGTWVHDTAFPLTGPARMNRGTVFFQGAYVEALYFLTGESRPYDRRQGVVTRVIPFENFFLVRGSDCLVRGGLGAWQVGARYSYLDLNDKGVTGGIVHDMTLGLNWFLNPNMKWQLNYSLARRDVPGAAGNGIVQGLGVRYAMDF
jgi:phosphate-selective porin OprO/OprP